MVRPGDYIQKIVDYIKRNLSKGYTLDALRWALIKQGVSRSEIERAIKIAQEQLAVSAPKLEIKPLPKVEIEEKKPSFWEKLKKIFK